MKNIKITIKQIEQHEGKYIAFYKSEFLDSTFCVYFSDSLQGSIAMLDFTNMLKSKYKTDDISFEISNEKLSFRSKELLNIMFSQTA